VQNFIFVAAKKENMARSRISIQEIVHLSLSGMCQESDTFISTLPTASLPPQVATNVDTKPGERYLLSSSVFREF